MYTYVQYVSCSPRPSNSGQQGFHFWFPVSQSYTHLERSLRMMSQKTEACSICSPRSCMEQIWFETPLSLPCQVLRQNLLRRMSEYPISQLYIHRMRTFPEPPSTIPPSSTKWIPKTFAFPKRSTSQDESMSLHPRSLVPSRQICGQLCLKITWSLIQPTSNPGVFHLLPLRFADPPPRPSYHTAAPLQWPYLESYQRCPAPR